MKIQRTLAEYFPDINLPVQPLMDWAIIQMKKSFDEDVTKGGIIIPGNKSSDEKTQAEWHEIIGKVVAIGPVFQKNRETMEPWPEIASNFQASLKVGDIVRIPEHVTGRTTISNTNGDDIKVIWIRDIQIMGAAIGDPLEMIQRVKAYVPLSERKI